MASPQEPKFDPNAALREFNAYFGSLRKDYGEDAIRGAGFTPRDLSLLQASLRKLQMDPNATPEQHRQAYQQARDALAQRITTPLAAARPTPSAPMTGVMPEVEVRGVMPTPPMPVEVSRPEMEVRGVRPVPGGNIPSVIITAEGYKPNPAYTADVAMQRYRAELPNNNYYSPQERQQIMSSIENAYAQPGVTGEQVSDAYQNASVAATRARPQVGPAAPVPSATDYISSMVTPPSPIDPSMMSPTMLGNAPPMPVAPPPMVGPVEPPLNIADDPSRGVIDNRIGPGFGKPMQPDVKPTLGDMFKGGIGSMLPPQATPMQPTAPGILPGITQMQPAAPSMNTQPGADFDRNVGRQIFDAEFRTLRDKYGDDGLRAAGLTPRTLASLQAPLTNVQRDNTISYDQSSAALENALQQLRGYNFGGAQPAAPMPAGAQGMAMGGLINKYYR